MSNNVVPLCVCRLSVQSHSREFDSYFLMKVGSMGMNNLAGLPLPEEVHTWATMRHKRRMKGPGDMSEYLRKLMVEPNAVEAEGDLFLAKVHQRRDEREKKMEIVRLDVSNAVVGSGVYVC